MQDSDAKVKTCHRRACWATWRPFSRIQDPVDLTDGGVAGCPREDGTFRPAGVLLKVRSGGRNGMVEKGGGTPASPSKLRLQGEREQLGHAAHEVVAATPV
jgi:hypothetical protein